MNRITNYSWSTLQLSRALIQRQQNNFDVVLIITGNRGNGKSTLMYHLLKKMSAFKLERDIAFTRREVMKQMENKRYGKIWADEMINVSHNRDFFSQDQKMLIKMVNMYRDRYNILGGCAPHFYDLDSQLRKLVSIRIELIERGLGIVMLPKTSLYTNDPWESKKNEKVENSYVQKSSIKRSAKYYSKLTTFAGYITFKPMREDEEKEYQELKDKRRSQIYAEENENDKTPQEKLEDNLTTMITNGNASLELIKMVSEATGVKYNTLRSKINTKLKETDPEKKLSDYLRKRSPRNTKRHNNNIMIR